MATTYILKRKTYSINPFKLTLSDISIEFGIQFPEEIKKLAKMERRIDAELHHWAVTAAGINFVASPEMMYEALSQGAAIIPALIDANGNPTLMYNIQSGKYVYGETELEDPSAFVNIVINDLQKVMMNSEATASSPEMASGDVEVMKQHMNYYQLYLNNVMLTFGIEPEAPQQ